MTMKYSRLYIVLISLFLGALTSQAQVARRPAARPAAKAAPKVVKPAPVVPTAEDLNFAKLLQSTAKVMFIDSLVTDADDVLKHIPLSSSCGKISIKNIVINVINRKFLILIHHYHELSLWIFSSTYC